MTCSRPGCPLQAAGILAQLLADAPGAEEAGTDVRRHELHQLHVRGQAVDQAFQHQDALDKQGDVPGKGQPALAANAKDFLRQVGDVQVAD